MHLRDIKQSIDNVSAFLEGIDFDSYCADLKTRSAVERQMQIITEAAIRLGADAETLCPGPDWRGFRGMGDVLRHEYHRVNDKIVGDTVQHELPLLRVAVDLALSTNR